jgi:hypothetical protein
LFLYAPDLTENIYLKYPDRFGLYNDYHNKIEFTFNGSKIAIDIFDHSEKLPIYKKAEKLANELKELTHLNFSANEAVKILNVYNISKKRS